MELFNVMDSFTCGWCNSRFSDFLCFIIHKIHHAGPKAAVKCIMCNEQFLEPKSFKEHLQVHALSITTSSCVDAAKSITETCQDGVNAPNLNGISPKQVQDVNDLDPASESSCFKKNVFTSSVFGDDVMLSESSSDHSVHKKSAEMPSIVNGKCSGSVKRLQSLQEHTRTEQLLSGKLNVTNDLLPCQNNDVAEQDPVFTANDMPACGYHSDKSATTNDSSSAAYLTSATSSGASNRILKEGSKDQYVDSLCESRESKINITTRATTALERSLNEIGLQSSIGPHSSDGNVSPHSLDSVTQSTVSKNLGEPSKIGHQPIPVRMCENLIQSDSGSSAMYTHMRSLLLSPSLLDKECGNGKPLVHIAQSLGDPKLLLTERVKCVSVASDVHGSLSLPVYSTSRSINSSSHSNSSYIRSTNSVTKSTCAPLQSSDMFLLPFSLNLTATSSTLCDTISLSHAGRPQTAHGHDTHVVSSVSLVARPVVASCVSSSMHDKTRNIDRSSERDNEMKDWEDCNILPVEVRGDKTSEIHSAVSSSCGKEGLLATNPSTLVDPTSKLEGTESAQTTSATAASLEGDTIPVDFYFFLGTMNIQGASLTYDRMDFRCLHCTFSTAWRPSLVKHMKHFHKDTLEIHKILDIRNNEAYDMQNEEMKCKKFQVMKMSDYLAGNQKFRKRSRKLERQDIPGKYHCSTCMKVFSRLRYLRRHQTTHRTERTHLCDNCGKSFKTKAILVAHRRSHKKKIYHCPQCSFVSCSSAAIHMHRQLHPNGSVICDTCGTAYIDKSTLNKHRKVHDQSRPFPCTHQGCTWRFKTDVMRKAHVRSHTSVGKFSCTFCGYNFRQKHHLHRHIAKIHSNQHMKSPSSVSSPADQSNHLTVSSTTRFTTQVYDRHESLASTNDKVKPPHISVKCNESLAASNGESVQSIHTSSTNHLLALSSDTQFSSNLVDPELAMIEVLVGNKEERLESLEEEKPGSSDIISGSLSNLEYLTENGEVVQLVRPGQTYVGRDQYGNLVQYKIEDVQDPNHNSHPIYFIGVDGTVVGATSGQEQALVVNSLV